MVPLEFGHAVGLYHEHQRPDRGLYVNIQIANINPNFRGNFNPIPDIPINVKTKAYDYQSIMHYGSYAFSINRSPTITKKTGEIISRGPSLSTLDKEMLNTLYPEKIDCKKIAEERPPKSLFEYTTEFLVCRGSEIQFINQSKGIVQNIQWRIPSLDMTISDEENPTVTFDQPGNYIVYLHVENEFGTSVSSQTINVQDSDDLIVKKVWPNPSKGQVSLEIGSDKPQSFYIEVMDRSGKLVYSETSELSYKCRSPQQFDLPESLPNGLYFIKFRIGKEQKTIQVELQR
ncbi:MAG: M12 family metallopeptidase [Bacteroidota bacterium]